MLGYLYTAKKMLIGNLASNVFIPLVVYSVQILECKWEENEAFFKVNSTLRFLVFNEGDEPFSSLSLFFF